MHLVVALGSLIQKITLQMVTVTMAAVETVTWRVVANMVVVMLAVSVAGVMGMSPVVVVAVELVTHTAVELVTHTAVELVSHTAVGLMTHTAVVVSTAAKVAVASFLLFVGPMGWFTRLFLTQQRSTRWVCHRMLRALLLLHQSPLESVSLCHKSLVKKCIVDLMANG
jgi:hypothetical protein